MSFKPNNVDEVSVILSERCRFNVDLTMLTMIYIDMIYVDTSATSWHIFINYSTTQIDDTAITHELFRIQFSINRQKVELIRRWNVQTEQKNRGIPWL